MERPSRFTCNHRAVEPGQGCILFSLRVFRVFLGFKCFSQVFAFICGFLSLPAVADTTIENFAEDPSFKGWKIHGAREVQKGGLTSSASSHQRRKLARSEFEIYVSQRCHRASLGDIALADALQAQATHTPSLAEGQRSAAVQSWCTRGELNQAVSTNLWSGIHAPRSVGTRSPFSWWRSMAGKVAFRLG